MNHLTSTIKTQDSKPNKIIVDIYSNFIDELYKKCKINQDQDVTDSDKHPDQD